MLVVGHVNGVPPAGPAASLDAAMGGALSRRAANGSLDAPFGSTQFLPASSSTLAAGSVLVVGLGNPAEFQAERLPEVGAAIVEAAASLGLRDAATSVHGTGGLGVPLEKAARLLMTGVLEAIEALPGAGALRELCVVEHDPAASRAVREGVRAARSGTRVHVYIEEGTLQPAPGAAAVAAPGAGYMPEHLRLSVTREVSEALLTVSGSDAATSEAHFEYPADFAAALPTRLADEVLLEEDPEARLERMRSLGHELFTQLIGRAGGLGGAGLLTDAPGDLVVLTLDDSTVDLPWELLYTRETGFLSREKCLARSLQLSTLGRQGAFVAPHSRMRVLVVGDPDPDHALPGARAEAEAVAKLLDDHPGAEVEALIGDVDFSSVSRELNAHSFDLLHYCGHARFDSLREGRSGLMLSDRVMTADDLSARRFLPRVFFANACNSAQTGDGGAKGLLDGAVPTRNLVSSLLAANVRAFLGSMWKVEDEPARTFAVAFYQALLERTRSTSVSVGHAVRHARAAVVEAHGEGHPAWAGYALYGSPWKPVL